MKPMHLRNLLLTFGLAGLLLQPAAAQTPKLGTIDLRKVFDTYWKTKQADANLKDEAAGLDKERKSMVDQFTKGQENYKKTLDSASDNAVSTEEREKRKKAAEEELVKLKELENNIQQFDRQARTTLGEKQRRMRDNLLGEIKEVIRPGPRPATTPTSSTPRPKASTTPPWCSTPTAIMTSPMMF
jgi:outer membrane protein